MTKNVIILMPSEVCRVSHPAVFLHIYRNYTSLRCVLVDGAVVHHQQCYRTRRVKVRIDVVLTESSRSPSLRPPFRPLAATSRRARPRAAMPLPPSLDFRGGPLRFRAVRRLRKYTDPYPDGLRIGNRLPRGAVVEVTECKYSIDYLCALTTEGYWVNLWCLKNRWGEERGIRFAVPA